MAEFALIQRYFSDLSPLGQDVLLGVGDDCALLQPPPGRQLAMTMDTLVAGRHFFPDVDPVSLGHKALAVNLSDLAAMGAEPAWALLSLTLPEANDQWLQGFVRGFGSLAGRYGVKLVGGDTCQGPLSISVHLTGFVDSGKAMLRANARPGDLVCVSGTLGDAALALRLLQAGEEPGELRERLDCPQPRVEEGLMLVRAGVRTCIDISDGLVADLGHICERSCCAARIEAAKLPLSPAFRNHAGSEGALHAALAGGDDYELCFTIPPPLQPQLDALSFDITFIGEIRPGQGVELVDEAGNRMELPRGWEHFSS
ncbi:thiamine-phosphate kinase [Thiolapillus sp.]